MEPLDPFSLDAHRVATVMSALASLSPRPPGARSPSAALSERRRKTDPFWLVREELLMTQLWPNLPPLRTGQRNLGHFGVLIPTTLARFHSSLPTPEKASAVI